MATKQGGTVQLYKRPEGCASVLLQKRIYIKLKRGIWTVSQKYKEEIGPRAMAVKSFGSELAAQCIGHGNQYPDQQQSLNICIARALYTYNTDSAVTLAWLPTRYYTSARLYIYFLFFFGLLVRQLQFESFRCWAMTMEKGE